MPKNYLFALIVVLTVSTPLVGCGGSSTSTPPSPPPPSVEFLYAASIDPQGSGTTISSFVFTPSTGSLQSTSTTKMTNVLVAGVVTSPSAKFLYASVRGPTPLLASFIDIFSISPTNGTLTPDGAFSLDVICAGCTPQSGPGELAIAPTGNTLYYASSTVGPVAQGVGALVVKATDGSLSKVPGSPFPTNDMPLALVVHPSGRFLYTANAVVNGFTPIVTSVSCFSIDSTTGAVTPVPGSPFPISVNNPFPQLVIDPSGKFLYMPTGMATSGVLGWSIDSTSGTITPLPNSPFAPASKVFVIAIDKAGNFLYASGGLGGGVLGFNIDNATGNLTALTGSPFSPGSTLGGQVVDPSGTWLFAVDTTQKALVAFALDKSTGSLTLSGSPPPSPIPLTTNLIITKAP